MNDERAVEGLEHLQTAALELIAAARAFLDVAEEVVREPGVAATIVHAAAGLGRVVRGAGEPAATAAETPPDEERVRRIHVM
jgi:N-formylglutamate amidohydrolase